MSRTCSTQSLRLTSILAKGSNSAHNSTPIRQRYQEGSISRVKRAKGPDVWIFRWRERQADSSLKQRKVILGDVERFPRLSDAKQAAEDLRADINRGPQVTEMNVRELWHHFRQNELDPNEDDRRSPVTIQVYKENMRGYVLPQWGDTPLSKVKAVEVERWLRSLPYAPATKCKFRNQLSCLFSHAIRWELYRGENPIRTVRQSSKRQSIPDILTLDEMRLIVGGLKDSRHRLAVLIAGTTALRRSEIRGLKWSDVDVEKRWLHLRRGIVRTVETKLKTEGSRRGVPLTDDLLATLNEWRQQSPAPTDHDWVLPSEFSKGPLWLDTVLQDYIQPLAKQSGITKKIGWHTFRRSVASLLAAKGENVKIVQELLRHSNTQMTMELYQQADADQKRQAQEHLRSLFLVKAS